MPSPRLVPILAATLGLAVSAEIPAEQALGIYGQTAPAHRELSPLWGMVSLKSGLLRNLRLYGAYGPAPLAELPRHPGLHGANDHPQDAVAGVIQYLFPSPDGVNFVPNQRTKDPIGALSREREKGLPRILALLDAITFRKGSMADARGASSSRATGSPDEAERDLHADVMRILGGGSPDSDSGYHRILGSFATMLARGVRQEVADGGRAYPPRVVEMALLGYAWTVADHVDEPYRAFSPELLLGPPERRPLPPAGQAYPDARLPGVLERMEVHRAGGGEPVLPDELAVFLNDQRTQGPLPELINYGMARHGEARYPDCGETSLRNFFNIAFTHEGVFSEVRFAAFLGRFPAPPTAKLMELQAFYRRFPRIAHQTTQAALFLAADIPGQSPQMALWVRFWIQHGLDPSTRFLGGVSILAWCAGSGSLPLVQEVLRAGARANDMDERGLTPLLGVVMAWKENPVFSTDGHALVQALLDAGADPLLAKGGGYAPLGLAQKLGLAELAGQFERNLMEKAERKGAF